MLFFEGVGWNTGVAMWERVAQRNDTDTRNERRLTTKNKYVEGKNDALNNRLMFGLKLVSYL